MSGSFLRDWRINRALSIEDLAQRTGVAFSAIEAIESGESDFSGKQLAAFAGALGCENWRILCGPPASDAFRVRLVAQMLRDVCVEAVTAFDDMGRLDDLKRSVEAEDFWLQVSAHFESAVEAICRASSSDPSVPSER